MLPFDQAHIPPQLGLTEKQLTNTLENALPIISARVIDWITPEFISVEVDMENRPEVSGLIPALLHDGNDNGRYMALWAVWHVAEADTEEEEAPLFEFMQQQGLTVYEIKTYVSFVINMTSPVNMSFALRFDVSQPDQLAAVQALQTYDTLFIHEKGTTVEEKFSAVLNDESMTVKGLFFRSPSVLIQNVLEHLALS